MLLFVLLVLLVSAYAAPEVRIGRTTIIGTEFNPANVEFFGGIPYAEAPVGELSLQSPIISTTLDGDTFHAETFGPACLQAGLPASEMSQDCLSINVFRPAGILRQALLPEDSLSSYNGTGIVSYSVSRGTPIIFASLNYRLGPLGFPQGIEADQLVGLEWLQANIGQFGGDKSKITVFGQSAGATSINIHLLQNRIASLARAVVIESDVTGAFYGPERNEAGWQQFVASIPECATLVNTTNTFECIRSANSTALLSAVAATGSGFQPVIDGPNGLIPDRPSQLVTKSHLPTIIGSNLDEGAVFTPQDTNSEEDISEFLTTGFTPSLVSPAAQAATIERILQLYPDEPALGSPFGTGNNTFGLSSEYKRFAAIWGDVLIQSPRRSFTQNMSATSVQVFPYYFTDPDAVPIPGLASAAAAPGSLGVTHSSEILYVFNELENRTSTAVLLSNIMQDYWISFATSLDPNDNRGHERPNWQQYTPRNQILMELNGHNTRSVLDSFQFEQIAFLQSNSDFFHR
ncbi:esterase 1 [Flammula alnicola]|nr:esterase 1 [Flammula alnicola]